MPSSVVRLRASSVPLTAGPHDHLAAQLAELHAACIQRDHMVATFLPPLDLPLMARWWQGKIDDIGRGTREILATVETVEGDGQELREVVTGVVMLDLTTGQTGPMRGAVEKLMVSPDHRRKGIARIVMGALETVAWERERWLLMLDTEQGSPAEKVYPRLGYTVVGVVPDSGISPKDGRHIGEVFFYKDLRKAGLLDGRKK